MEYDQQCDSGVELFIFKPHWYQKANSASLATYILNMWFVIKSSTKIVRHMNACICYVIVRKRLGKFGRKWQNIKS